MSKTATKDKAPAAPSPEQSPAVLPASALTGRELHAWVKETAGGTLPGRLDAVRQDVDLAFLEENPEATGEQFYRHLEKTGAKWGTLNRVGSRVWGPKWQGPGGPSKYVAEEDLVRLREQNARLESNVRALSAEKLGLQQANNHLRAELDRLANQVSYLKIGRAPEELAAAGMGK